MDSIVECGGGQQFKNGSEGITTRKKDPLGCFVADHSSQKRLLYRIVVMSTAAKSAVSRLRQLDGCFPFPVWNRR